MTYQYSVLDSDKNQGLSTEFKGWEEAEWSQAAVSRFLQGVPEKLVAKTSIADLWTSSDDLPQWQIRMADRARRGRAAKRRSDIIHRIVGRLDWSDHGRIWRVRREVVAIEGRPYHLSDRDLAEVREVARLWDLALQIELIEFNDGPAWSVLLSRKTTVVAGVAR